MNSSKITTGKCLFRAHEKEVRRRRRKGDNEEDSSALDGIV